jgi:hypothetical protein
MTGETHAARYLIRGGRIYDHDGDIHREGRGAMRWGQRRAESPGESASATWVTRWRNWVCCRVVFSTRLTKKLHVQSCS